MDYAIKELIDILKADDAGNTIVARNITNSDYVVAVMTREQYDNIAKEMVKDPRSTGA